MKKYVVLLGILICGTASADRYSCTGSKATGFLYDKQSGEWVQSKFKVGDHRYIIEPFKKGGYRYRVLKEGDEFALANCKNGFDKYGFLTCSKLWIEFRFNRHNNRYLKMNAIGYYNVLPDRNGTDDATSRSPMIEIGTCSEVQAE